MAEELTLNESDDDEDVTPPEDRQAALEARIAELEKYLLLESVDDDDDG
jgi:hypothetical protein